MLNHLTRPARRFASRRAWPILIIALVGATVTAPSQGASPGDAVRFHGTVNYPTFGDVGLAINARSDADGSNPTGTMTQKSPDGTIIKVTVECLHVVGSTAYIGFSHTAPDYASVLIVTDDSPDTVQNTDATTSDCNGAFNPTSTVGTVTKGDIKIVDN